LKIQDTTYDTSAELLLNATIEAINMPAAIIDVGFQVKAINDLYKKEFYDIFCIKINPGDNLYQLLKHLPDEQKQIKLLWEQLINGKNLDLTLDFGDPSVDRRTYQMAFKPLTDKKGNLVAVLNTGSFLAAGIKNRQLLKEKKDHEYQFKNALNAMLDGVIIFEPSGKISYFNQQANTILANSITIKDRQELLDNIIFEDEEGNLLEESEIPSTKAFLGIPTRKKILKLRIRDNAPIWIDVSTSPIYNYRQELHGVILNFRDITEEMQFKEALRESENRFHIMAENISQLAWMADAKGNIFWYNKRWFEFTGTTLDEMEGLGWTKVHHPDHVDRVVAKFRKCWDTGEPWEDVFPLKNKNGEYRWFLSRALPVQESNGSIKYWFGTNTDITDNKILEEKLKIEHDLLGKIIDTIPVMISIYEPDINVVYLNKAIEKATGWTNEDAKAHGIMNLVYPDPEYRKGISEYMQSMKPGFKEIQMTCKNGGVKVTSWANIHIPDGRRVGIGIDLTEIKQYERELVKANLELQQKNGQLKRFSELLENLLYMAAHDLRSPIANLQLMMYLISQEEQLEKKLEYLPDFEDMVKRLNNVIDGLIEIIESQQENDTLLARKINIEDCINDIQIELKDELAQSQAKVNYNIDCHGEIIYIAAFFQSILKNLLSNAIKYRDPHRKLIIDMGFEKQDEFLLMTVRDNGMGFDVTRNAKNLFKPFKRFTSTGSGTGIGLYIVKSFIEKNGGYIKVDSKMEEGTIFYCYLKQYDLNLGIEALAD
jgi:PAS domain S-box-containing protein